jgi:hypothetical protein
VSTELEFNQVSGLQPQDYIEGFADLVVPNDPDAFRDRLLAGVVARFAARNVALFSLEEGRLRLVASSAINQASLDRANSVLDSHRSALEARKPVVERPADGAPALIAVPIATPEGLLYIEADALPVHEPDAPELQRLADLASIGLRQNGAGPLHSRASGYLRQASEDDLLRDKLLLSLQEHEWNIARVARLLGVTRRTIYLRLERWGIQRRKVVKTLRREA